MSFAQSQDLIVTTSGDSLNCKVTKNKGGFIQFTYVHPQTGTVSKSILSTTKVSAVVENFYDESPLPDALKARFKYPKIRINGNLGYSYKLGVSAASTAEEQAYEKDIRNGFRFGAEFDYFFNDRNGLGLKFSRFQSKADLNIEFLVDENGDSTVTYLASEKLRISQISLLWRRRWINYNGQNAFNLGLGLGAAFYRDQITFLDISLYERATSVAIDLELSYDIGLSEYLSLTIGGDITTGYFENSTIEYPDGTTESVSYREGEGISMGRASAWIGLTLRL